MSNKEDKHHNITFDIDSSDDEEIQVIKGDSIFQRKITKIKKKNIIKKPKEEGKKIEQEPKIGEKKPWKTFVKEQTTGKKFRSRQEVNEYMKELSKRYKSVK